MFTGLVQDMGTVDSLARGSMTRIAIATSLPAEEFELGESVAVDGACLTVAARSKGRFEVEVSPETLRRTTLGDLAAGARVNLERALRLSDRLGGHLVQGHVDAPARVLSKEQEGGSVIMAFELSRELAPFFIEKGSVAVDGVSLTVNRLLEDRFAVSLIPETQSRTTLLSKGPGQRVNLEADLVGKYIARLLGRSSPEKLEKEKIDLQFLERCGFT